ncbi:hypothetical protein AB0A05_27070 [Streptomyces sp. NPDC046374]|uniref:hypothetical protein n=1 Tax=Streptomyces sp. NPDC046374 TaxID=3154917 RepID=UPI0033EF008F
MTAIAELTTALDAVSIRHFAENQDGRVLLVLAHPERAMLQTIAGRFYPAAAAEPGERVTRFRLTKAQAQDIAITVRSCPPLVRVEGIVNKLHVHLQERDG